jgi:hypothetical protein
VSSIAHDTVYQYDVREISDEDLMFAARDILDNIDLNTRSFEDDYAELSARDFDEGLSAFEARDLLREMLAPLVRRGSFPCRYPRCDKKFLSEAQRNSHEVAVHGKLYEDPNDDKPFLVKNVNAGGHGMGHVQVHGVGQDQVHGAGHDQV